MRNPLAGPWGPTLVVAVVGLMGMAIVFHGTELRDKQAPDVRAFCAKDTGACFATCERASLELYESQSAGGLYDCPNGEPLACLCIARRTTNERAHDE